MAKKKIKGITIEIGGDTKPLEAALGEVDKKSRDLQGELKKVDKLLKLDPKNVELAAQKEKLLADSVENARVKLDALKQAEKEVDAQFARGEIKEEQYREFRREVIRAEQSLKSLKQQAQSTAKTVDNMGDKLKKAADKIENAGEKLKDAGGKMSGVSAVSAGAIAASVTGAATLEGAANKAAAATDKALGGTEQYRDLIKDIYSDNFGEGFEDIADKISLVKQQMDDIDDTALLAAVENGYLLQDAWDVDFNEGLRGANALVKQFGISSEEAYDLLVQGAQKGLNQNQDLADQISEYSVYFSDMGYSAEEMFNIIASGAEKGIFQIDYLNDAMKEFSIRTIAGDAEDALKALGFDAIQTQRKIAAGGREGAQAATKVIEALSRVNDEVLQNQYGVELFGTKWEDSGRDACLALADVNGAIQLNSGKLNDAMDTMYSGASANMQTAMRDIAVAGAEIGEALLPTIAEIAKVISEVAKEFSNLPDSVKQGVLGILMFVAVIAPFLMAVGQMTTGIGQMIQFFGEGAAGAKMLASVSKGLASAWSGVTSAAGALAAALGVSIPAALGVVGLAIGSIIAVFISVKNHTQEWKDFMYAVFFDLSSLLPPQVQSLIEKIKAPFSGLPDWMKTIGGFIMKGLLNGITGGMATVIETVRNMIKKIKDMFTSVKGFDIHSPSKWSYGIGGYLGEGFTSGFADSIKNMRSVIDTIKSGFAVPALATVSTVNHKYSGAIDVNGVNDRGTAVYSTQMLMSNIADELARERRRR